MHSQSTTHSAWSRRACPGPGFSNSRRFSMTSPGLRDLMLGELLADLCGPFLARDSLFPSLHTLVLAQGAVVDLRPRLARPRRAGFRAGRARPRGRGGWRRDQERKRPGSRRRHRCWGTGGGRSGGDRAGEPDPLPGSARRFRCGHKCRGGHGARHKGENTCRPGTHKSGLPPAILPICHLNFSCDGAAKITKRVGRNQRGADRGCDIASRAAVRP